MPRQLINAEITHVSYVDSAANQRRFFLTKADKRPTFQKRVRLLTKQTDEQKLVYGVVYQPDVVDSQGDYMTAAEIERAAHHFMANYRQIDRQHNFEAGYGTVVESYVAPDDLEVGGQVIPRGSWVLVTRASDEMWDEIKRGNITGYSMGGTAEVLEDGVQAQATVRKNQASTEFWASLAAMQDVIATEMAKDLPDTERIKSVTAQFSDLLARVAIAEDVIGTVGQPPEQRMAAQPIEVPREDIQEIVAEEVVKILRKNELEQPPQVTIKQVQDLLQAELTPLAERIEALERARGISKAHDASTGGGRDSQSVWNGLFHL
ncbi:XkdF-like putative serine protease domain-containing protein [Brevibacillus dissolubilis]|uniref:XkdF-like putative serine protease domain-containing protein n=1 Tax=Brevibacillus dissolubilis TaxID=1844116 RepID=UPI001115EA70|nr:XkdF-like putative serine protease domain-containing protein [Brevibacillus dissolubilis]